jgi:hypothetical protein
MLGERLSHETALENDSFTVRVRDAFAPQPFLALLFCLMPACLPVLITALPPLGDYPNHLARAHVLAHWQESELFQQVFDLDSLLLPNVLTDIWVAVLSRWIGTLAAGQALLLLIVILTFVGAFVLNSAATRQPSNWPLLVGLFLYNEVFFMGFLNYLLGIALVLWGCAAWLLLELGRRQWQWTVTSLFALLILFSHLVAFGLFAVAIAILEADSLRRRRQGGVTKQLIRISAIVMAFTPAILLYLMASPARGLPFVLDFDQDDLLFKKLSPFTRILSSGNTSFDLVVLGGALLIILGAFVRRSVSLEPRLTAISAAFALLALILPHGAMESYFLDKRIAVPTVILFLAALRPRREGRQGIWVAGILALMVLRSSVLTLDWQATGRDYAAVLEGLRSLPEGTLVIPGTSLMVPYAQTWFLTSTHFPPWMHVANYATIVRGSVIPHIFAKRGQNPVVFQPTSVALRAVIKRPDLGVESDGALRNLAALASAVRQTDPVFASRGVHLLLFGVTCDRWLALIPLPPLYCGGNFSIVEIPAEISPDAVYGQHDHL